jgi:hypothetical protein
VPSYLHNLVAHHYIAQVPRGLHSLAEVARAASLAVVTMMLLECYARLQLELVSGSCVPHAAASGRSVQMLLSGALQISNVQCVLELQAVVQCQNRSRCLSGVAAQRFVAAKAVSWCART